MNREILRQLAESLRASGNSLLRRAAVASLVLLVPLPAVAEDLASTPVRFEFLLPAAPVPEFQIGAAPETPQSFLAGRFLVGAVVGYPFTPGQDLSGSWKISPFIRNTPRRIGWGPSFGLSWFKGDIAVSLDGRRTTIGEVKVRPVMAGVSYTMDFGRARASISLVGGYAFTSATLSAALPSGTSAAIDINDAWVVRPGVGVTYALKRRLALVGSLSYVYATPTVTVRVAQRGEELARVSGSFRGDYVAVSGGIAFSIF